MQNRRYAPPHIPGEESRTEVPARSGTTQPIVLAREIVREERDYRRELTPRDMAPQRVEKIYRVRPSLKPYLRSPFEMVFSGITMNDAVIFFVICSMLWGVGVALWLR